MQENYVDYEVDEILAENKDSDVDSAKNDYAEKRSMLDNTKIVKQTWSIQEMYQKYKSKKLELNPNYQRNVVWGVDKKTSFIESLFMGILIPPIYVVEIPGETILDGNTYEIVDGKQRLSTIINFLEGKIKLQKRYLEYYGDIFVDKNFNDIYNDTQYSDYAKTLLSSVLDFYVITANSPEFTKYDIFSRLNRGAEPLRVDEIRKAIYRSETLRQIELYVDSIKGQDLYKTIFTKNDIKHYKDFGRFYRSLAFYTQTSIENNDVIGYNSRPRDMINNVLRSIQKKEIVVENDKLQRLLDKTMELKNKFLSNTKGDFLIDALIPFEILDNVETIDYSGILADNDFQNTLNISPGTTTNVCKRIEIVKKYVKYR